MTWRDKSTLRGQLEAVIDPIISGGAPQHEIDAVVDSLMAFFPKEPKPSESILALKRAIRREAEVHSDDLDILQCRLHNIRNIIMCTSWTTP